MRGKTGSAARKGGSSARAADPTVGARLRLGALALVALAALGFLALRLHDVQVRDSETYESAQNRTSLRRVRLPATRGRILDREGRILADSAPRYCAALYLDELRAPGRWSNTVARIDKRIDDLAAVIGRPREIGTAEIWTHLKRRRPIPLVAFRNLDDREMARLSECPEPLAGVGIEAEQDRTYPFGDLACHVIGYVGRGTPDDSEDAKTTSEPVRGPDETGARSFDFLLPDLVGRGGVEKRFDRVLSGRGGARLLRIDAVGYAREAIPAARPVPGRDVVLTLDASVQRLAEDALGTNRGAAVVLDARSGDILALASAPRYDLRAFAPRLRPETWKALLADRDRPLLHRAASGLYPPGSIVKPAVALAALSSGALYAGESLVCDGAFSLGARRIRCSSRWGHGAIGVVRALASSCNPFFIETGLRLGWDGPRGLRSAYEALGFGSAPMPDSSAGVLPDAEWKKRRIGDRWRDGDTANASIGQGFMLVTPLQAARYAMALARGGEVPKLRLVRDPGSGLAETNLVIESRLPWHPLHVALVREGMLQAVEGAHGTARRARIPWLRWAAKTGTAEYGPRKERNYAWIIAFAPVDDPRCAIAVVAEDSDHGGQTAAAVARHILVGLYPPPPEFAAEEAMRTASEAHESSESAEAVESGELPVFPDSVDSADSADSAESSGPAGSADLIGSPDER